MLLIAAVLGGAVLLSVATALLVWAASKRAARRRAEASGLSPEEAARVGVSLLATLAAGVGCFAITCLFLLAAWFAFILWAFRDFKLF